MHFTSHLSDTVFDSLAMRKSLEHKFTTSWAVESADFSPLLDATDLEVRWREDEGPAASVIMEGDDSLVRLMLVSGRLHVQALVPLGARQEWEERLRARFPERELAEELEVRFWFWESSKSCPSEKVRVLEAPTWERVERNYAGAVRQRLATTMAATEPAAGGQLILWHGEPGTGKTHAIKALGREWSKWCSVEYITDPERFFGTASYLIGAMLEEPVRHQEWRLLVLEDTGELMLPDARNRLGQGLSRLLNVVDGLIGQGLKVLLLVTTNEPLEKLHPAVSRPGRCASIVEFEPFTQEEAQSWALENGLDLDLAPRHLSDLFALKEQASNRTRAPRSALGFSR